MIIGSQRGSQTLFVNNQELKYSYTYLVEIEMENSFWESATNKENKYCPELTVQTTKMFLTRVETCY